MSDQPRQIAHSTATVGTTEDEAVAANPNRSYLLLINQHATQIIYLKFGGVAAVANEGIRLNAAGGSLEISGRNGNLDTRAIRAVADGANTPLLISEA